MSAKLKEVHIYKSKIKTEMNSDLFQIIGIPENFEEGSGLIVPSEIRNSLYYNKALVEGIINILLDAVNSLDKTVAFDSLTTKSNLPDRLLVLLNQMSNLLQWFTNSTSWYSGELKDYDKQSINQKLETLKKIL